MTLLCCVAASYITFITYFLAPEAIPFPIAVSGPHYSSSFHVYQQLGGPSLLVLALTILLFYSHHQQ